MNSTSSDTVDTTQAEMATANLASLSRAEVIAKFKRSANDTGSPEVQIALVTQRLETLLKHAGSNPNDHHSKRGMLALISLRKQLLQYLREADGARYKATIAALGLRK